MALPPQSHSAWKSEWRLEVLAALCQVNLTVNSYYLYRPCARDTLDCPQTPSSFQVPALVGRCCGRYSSHHRRFFLHHLLGQVQRARYVFQARWFESLSDPYTRDSLDNTIAVSRARLSVVTVALWFFIHLNSMVSHSIPRLPCPAELRTIGSPGLVSCSPLRESSPLVPDFRNWR